MSDKYLNLPCTSRAENNAAKRYFLYPVNVELPRKVMFTSKELKPFDLKGEKRQRISKYLNRRINRSQSVKICEKLPKINDTQLISSIKIENFCKNAPISDLSRFQERKIKQKIAASKLERNFPEIIEEFMNEAKIEYRKIIQSSTIISRLTLSESEEYSIKPYKYLGKTENFRKFLSTKKQFEIRYFLSDSVITTFFQICIENVPNELFQIEIFSAIEAAQLEIFCKQKAETASIILQDFHKSALKYLQTNPKITQKHFEKFLPICDGLFSLHISKTIDQTLRSIVKFTECTKLLPFLKLYVDFQTELVLIPTVQEVIEIFHKLIDDIINTAKDLNIMYLRRTSKKIFLCLTEEFIKDCKEKIAENIRNLFTPIWNFLNTISLKFSAIFPVEAENCINLNFDQRIQEIKFFDNYIKKVVSIPDNEYFKIGQLNLANYRLKLWEILKSKRNSIFKNLASEHLKEITGICDNFQLIKIEAIKKCSTTEELIEIGKFMNSVKDGHLDYLTEKVYELFEILCTLITIGILESVHIAKNSEAVNWLENISPIIEKYNIEYEQLKFEAEDKLQKIIEDISTFITDIYPLLVILDEMDDIKLVRSYLNKINLHMSKIKYIQDQIDWVNKEEICLNFPKSHYQEFENLKDYVYPFYHLLKLTLDIQKYVSVWNFGQFDQLESVQANEMVKKFLLELENMRKSFKKRLRKAQDENSQIRFKGTLDDPDILNWPAPLKLCAKALEILEFFKPSLKIMEIMCNKALRTRHWKSMSEIAGFNLKPNTGTTLKKIVDCGIDDNLDKYAIISICATKEQELLNNLNSLKKYWNNINFTISNYHQQLLLIDLNLIQSIIDDHSMELTKMKSSVFVKPYRSELESFFYTMRNISEIITKWEILQNSILQLEPLFLQREIINNYFALDDLKKFNKCVEIFQKYIQIIRKDANVLKIISENAFLKDLKIALCELEQIQKTVNNYLEILRLKCPRLFFISDQEILNFLLINDNENFNPHFCTKIFPLVNRIKFDKKTAILISKEAEELRINNPIKSVIINEVIAEIITNSCETIKNLTSKCYKIFNCSNIEDLVKNYPQQILQLISRIFWTEKLESSLKLSHNIKILMYKRKLEENLKFKINLLNTKKLNQKERTIINNILITDINNIYLLNSLIKDGLIINEAHFLWKIQLRYSIENSVCKVKFLNYQIDYGNEYFGNFEPYLINSVTEKCVLTILNAYFNQFFGLIRGGNKTGKSTISNGIAKDLGKFFYSLVIINTEHFFANSLMQIIKGIVLCGGWLGLNGISALKLDLISSLSQQLLNILNCKRTNSHEIFIETRKYAFNSSCFLTINLPHLNKNFNVKLPESFKVLFRTFTLSHPDLLKLIETFFFCQGIFTDHKLYAKKLISCLTLLEKCFPGNNFKELNLVREILKNSQKIRVENPNLNYFTVICCSIRIIFECKFSVEDRNYFEEILAEIFQEFYQISDVQKFNYNYDDSNILNLFADKNNLILTELSYKKFYEVYNFLNQRKHLILLGNTFSGKTTTLKLNFHIFNEIKRNAKIELHILDPINTSYEEFKGTFFDDVNFRCYNGLLIKLIKNSIQKESNIWILIDGQINPNWSKNIEDFLMNNEIMKNSLETLKFNGNLTFILETTKLKSATPSLVSKCATIFFPESSISYSTIIDSWFNSYYKLDWLLDYGEMVKNMLKWVFPACINFFKTLDGIKLDNRIILKNVTTYFELIFNEAIAKTTKKNEDSKNLLSWIHATLLQAAVMGFYGPLSEESRLKFDQFFKELWKNQNPDYPYPVELEKLEIGIPVDGILYDYCYLYKQRGAWKLWSDLLKNEKIIEENFLFPSIIPTVEMMRYKTFLNSHIKYKKELMILGPKCSGKSILINDFYLNKLDENNFAKSYTVMNKKSITTQNFLDKIFPEFSKKGDFYELSGNRRFLCFIDDLHDSAKNNQEISYIIEFLRHYLDHKLFYNNRTLDNVILKNLNFIVTTITALPQRFMRHFNIFCINSLKNENILRIFSQSLIKSWKKSGFPNDMVSKVDLLVNVTLNIYENIKNQLKITLNKPHYLFNIRSLRKVIEGCCLLKKENYDLNKKIFIKVWVHEILRVFASCLYKEDDQKFQQLLNDALSEYFPDDFVEVFGENPNFSGLFFGFWPIKNNNSANIYEEISLEYLYDVCLQIIQDYNQKHSYKLDLYFFSYSLEKIAQICRLISNNHCNVLLLGLTGSGRKSLTQFAAFLFNFHFFQLTLTENSNEENFKNVLKLCGGNNKKCVYLITEEHLEENEYFLDNLDHYLRLGDITDFFSIPEKQQILELSRLDAQAGNEHLEVSAYDVFMHFNKKCRENLHLFLSLNTTSKKLRQRICDYPSLVTNLDVILWQDWPNSALEFISGKFLQDFQCPEETKTKLIKIKINFHRIAQQENFQNFCVTSHTFVHLNKIFVDLINKKEKILKDEINKYQCGLAKLSYAETQILNMQKSLADYQPLLEKMTKNAIEMTKEIALETLQVEKASALVRKDEKIASQQAAIAETLKSECEAELAQAIPILEDAISALNTLKPSDITLVKSMKNPPDAIKLVMASICVMKEIKPDRIPDSSTGRKTLDYWGPSKRILGDMNFLQYLKDFDKDHIKLEIIEKIRKEFLPHKDFKPQIVAKASSAAEGLCKWIIAMEMYDKVAKEVAPKKEKLNKAEKEYAETMKILTEKMADVARIEEKLAQLKMLLEEATKKQFKLKAEVDICRKKLENAQNLIGGLSDEKERWTNASENLTTLYKNLLGDILLTSAIIAYSSSCSKEERGKLLKRWKIFIYRENLPITKQFKFLSVFNEDNHVDDYFMENCIIFENSKQFCVFLDPHEQATEWIINKESCNNLTITKFCFKEWFSSLKKCLAEGKPILIKDTTGKIPNFLNPLIFQHYLVSAEGNFVKINRENIKINLLSKVYLIMNCHEESLHYNEEIKSRLLLINFSLTKEVLENKIMKFVLGIEKPQYRQFSNELSEKTRENKLELCKLQLKVLNTLCESELNILEDEKSILILDESKKLFKLVEAKQNNSKDIAENFKQNYLKIGEYISSLFFSLSNLRYLNIAYDFSLRWFKNVFFLSIINNAAKSKNLEIRCENICTAFTLDLFKILNRGMFEKHKLFFQFWIACEMEIINRNIRREEVLTFFELECKNCEDQNFKKIQWICEKTWRKLNKIIKFKSFHEIIENISKNSNQWIQYTKIENADFPQEINDKIKRFHRLILIRIFKPDSLYLEINTFIKTVLGVKFCEQDFFSMQETYNESYNLMPIIFILTPGLNILDILLDFVRFKKMNKFHYLTMNEANFSEAEELINYGQKNGSWILLENCHLAKNWLYKLERQIEELNYENTHQNFRLFLTTASASVFPLEFIRNSTKIINEQPKNFTKKLINVYKNVPVIIDDYYYGCPGKQEIFSKFLYYFCSFHCLLLQQQSNNFSNLNLPYYKFEEHDFKYALKLLQLIINEENCIEEKIQLLIGECTYNGYVEFENVKNFIRIMLKDSFRNTNLPNKNGRADYIRFIENIQEENTKFHNRNFEINSFIKLGIEMFQLPEETLLDKKTDAVLEIVEDLLKTIPESCALKIHYSRFIQIEINLYNSLLQEIHSCLKTLTFALNNEIIFSDKLQEVALNVLENKIPTKWLKLSFPTLLSLSRFSQSVNENVKYLSAKENSKEIFLKSFYYPKNFLIELKLNFAKKFNVSYENVELKYRIMSDEENGIIEETDKKLLKGLFMIGAQFDTVSKKMIDLSPNLYFSILPSILVVPKILNNSNNNFSTNEYQCCIFRTEEYLGHNLFMIETKNYIMQINFECLNIDTNYWIKKCVYLVCEIAN